MVNIKTIQFQRTIQAPVSVVWETMFSAESYTAWTAPFSEGSYFDGSWDQGSRIKFLTPSGDGMVAEIAENREHERLSIRHLGFVFQGTEDTESEAVQAWAPAYETYTFSAVPEGTRLVIDQDVTEDFEQGMRDTWPKALDRLRELCERERDG